MLGSGQQGAVYEHKSNNNKVVKKRTFKRRRLAYKENSQMTRALNNYYSKQLKLVFKNSNVTINKNTSSLINKYPDYFEEAFLQYEAGKANLSAKVHEIFATEEKNSNNTITKVHIYIVMDKLIPVASTQNERKNLVGQAIRRGIMYQNGTSWGAKENHVMTTKNGKKLLINFGNSRFLSPAEIIERAPKTYKTKITAIGPNHIIYNN
jgi:hypothetical protein